VNRILIVDDEASIRRSLGGILSDEGFEPAEAPDGEAALAQLREGAPDLVLRDIAMPGRDGVQILEEMQRSWPGLPVVMMSGHGTIETAVRATQLGAFDFLEKPLSVEKLLLTIRHALDRASLERENRRLRAEAVRAHVILGDSAVVQNL
jgi:two-component system nitrogen regulation response regulator NtrX